jgi:hypothetical protein
MEIYLIAFHLYIVPGFLLTGSYPCDFTSVPALESGLRRFMTCYNVTMAHSFNWTYTGRPLQKTRRAHFVPPHCRNERSKPQSLAAP